MPPEVAPTLSSEEAERTLAERREAIVATVVNALDTSAFLCADPGSPDDAAPDQPLFVSMTFHGRLAGRFELIAGRHLGRTLAANMLACDAEDDEANAAAEDSLRELVNVWAGATMPELAETDADTFSLGLPKLHCIGVDEWSSFAADERTTVLDVEGMTMAVRVLSVATEEA